MDMKCQGSKKNRHEKTVAQSVESVAYGIVNSLMHYLLADKLACQKSSESPYAARPVLQRLP